MAYEHFTGSSIMISTSAGFEITQERNGEYVHTKLATAEGVNPVMAVTTACPVSLDKLPLVVELRARISRLLGYNAIDEDQVDPLTLMVGLLDVLASVDDELCEAMRKWSDPDPTRTMRFGDAEGQYLGAAVVWRAQFEPVLHILNSLRAEPDPALVMPAPVHEPDPEPF